MCIKQCSRTVMCSWSVSESFMPLRRNFVQELLLSHVCALQDVLYPCGTAYCLGIIGRWCGWEKERWCCSGGAALLAHWGAAAIHTDFGAPRITSRCRSNVRNLWSYKIIGIPTPLFTKNSIFHCSQFFTTSRHNFNMIWLYIRYSLQYHSAPTQPTKAKSQTF